MARYAMLIDTHTCIGCLACSVACKVEKGSPRGIWFAPVIVHEDGTFPDVHRVYLPLLCMHCESPPCVQACPSAAIIRRDDGIVFIDAARCCGSRACELACPYGAIRFYDGPAYYYGQPTILEEMKLAAMPTGTAQKCDLCAPLIGDGRLPACVEVCPTDSRIFGDLDDPDSAVSRRLVVEPAVALGDGALTRPGVRYTVRGLKAANPSPQLPGLPFRRQRIWDLPHAVEAWVLGTGAGLYLSALLLGVDVRRWGLSLVSVIALALVVFGGLVLVTHLGRPGRFLTALRNQRTSWLSRGALADFVFISTMVALALPSAGGSWGMLPLRALGTVAALLVITYPALAMASYRSVPAWSGWRLPSEFLVEGLAAGVSLVVLLDPQGPVTALGVPLLMVFALVRLALVLHRSRALSAREPGMIPARESLRSGAGAPFDRWGVRIAGLAGTMVLGGAALLADGSVVAWLAALAAGCTLLATFAGKVVALRIGARPVPESP